MPNGEMSSELGYTNWLENKVIRLQSELDAERARAERWKAEAIEQHNLCFDNGLHKMNMGAKEIEAIDRGNE